MAGTQGHEENGTDEDSAWLSGTAVIGTGQLQCAQDPNAAKQTVRHVFKSLDHLAMTTRMSHLRRGGASATLTVPPWVEDGDPDAAVVEQAGFTTCCCHKGQEASTLLGKLPRLVWVRRN